MRAHQFFSSLYSMLPSAKKYFTEAAYSPAVAASATIGFFVLGVVGLQAVSELLHHMLPSSIVKCEEHGSAADIEQLEQQQPPLREIEPSVLENGDAECGDEQTPLLSDHRPSLRTKLSSMKLRCDKDGRCYGYADHDCDQACKRARERRQQSGHAHTDIHHPTSHPQPHSHETDGASPASSSSSTTVGGHHHVAKNQFLSIGVQTSIAIALHKFPEGFITYATNAANPSLGFTVFLALFIHNIAEGFAMSLPLFLAVQSRPKAILWASLLGGLAQPAGATVAWLGIRGRANIDTAVYGALFAVTAGIMCSVGLQLFTQAVLIHHGGRLAFVCAFAGMAILGISSALTA